MANLRYPACVALLLLLGACRGPQPAAPTTTPESVAFVKNAPKIGRISIEESTVQFRMVGEGRAPGGASTRTTTETIERERRREEVLAVFDRVVTKKRIIYELLEKREIRDGAPVPGEASPLAGHTYVASLEKGSLVLTSATGGPVSEPERKDLTRRLSGLGKPDPFLEGIPDGVVSVNQTALAMKGGFLEVLEGSDEGPDVGDVQVRFVGTRHHPQGKCGVFSFQVAVQMAGEPRLSMDLRGELLVRIADSAAIELNLRGPARLVGRQKIENVDVALDGKGEMQGTVRITYL